MGSQKSPGLFVSKRVETLTKWFDFIRQTVFMLQYLVRLAGQCYVDRKMNDTSLAVVLSVHREG